MNVNNSYKFVKTLQNQRDEIEQIHKEKSQPEKKAHMNILAVNAYVHKKFCNNSEVNKILDRVGNMSSTEASDDDKKTEVWYIGAYLDEYCFIWKILLIT